VNETRARGAEPCSPPKLPMMAHLELGFGLAIGAIFGLVLALLNPFGQGWSVRLGATGDELSVAGRSYIQVTPGSRRLTRWHSRTRLLYLSQCAHRVSEETSYLSISRHIDFLCTSSV
jgi:hypothetical protein